MAAAPNTPLQRWLEARWYAGAPVPWWLAALSRLFAGIVALRGWLYRRGLLRSTRLGVPVLVVGNLGIGGAGKTPLTIALVHALRARGWHPGVVSRGYGRKDTTPRRVEADSRVELVGDEPLLIARRAACPVAVASRRVDAANLLLAAGSVDLIIADDGLQHYALARSVEVLVVDGRRGFGNGRLLPAGPLREPLARAVRCDFVVVNGEAVAPGLPPDGVCMPLRSAVPRALLDGVEVPWESLGDVQALAGIADPERFFAALRARGLRVDGHGFPDHHAFGADDFAFDDGRPLLLTEKDAAKCAPFARPHWLVVAVEAELPDHFLAAVNAALRGAAAATPPSPRMPHA